MTGAQIASEDGAAQREAERKLRESEERLQRSADTFRSLIEDNPMGVYVIDAGFKMLHASLGARRVFQNVPPPLIGRDLRECLRTIWPEPFASDAIGRFQHTLATGEPFRVPSTVERRRGIGEVEAYDWRLERISLPDGRFGVVCYYYDLTERNALEQKLREGELRLRQLYSAMNDGLAVHEIVYDDAGRAADYRLVEVNPAFETITGIRRELAIGALASQLYGSGAPPFLDVCARVVASGRAESFETQFGQMAKSFRISVFSPAPGRFATVFTDITSGKQAEEALRESEERLRFAWQATRDVIWDWDVEKDQQRWSVAGADLFGWTDAVESPQTAAWWTERVHPQDRQRVAASFHAALADPACHLWQDEYRFLRQDGSVADVLDRGYVIRDAAGKPKRMIGAITDITARKRAEEALRESEERYRLMIETAQEGVWQLDGGGCTTYVNRPMAAMLGYAVEEMEGRHLFDFMDPTAQAEAEKLVQRRRQGVAEQHDFRFRRKDGHDVWTIVSTNPSLDANGHFAGALAFITDITARKRAEAELRESEERLALAASGTRIGIFERNLDTGEIMATEQNVRLLGLQPTTAITTASTTTLSQKYTYAEWAGRVHPEDLPRVKAELDRCMAGHLPFEADYRVVWGDGSEHWLASRGVFHFCAAGRPRRLLGILMDITERKRAEMQLAASLDELRRIQQELVRQERLATLGQLAGSVAHEMRTPLTVIRSNTFFLEQCFPAATPEIREVLGETNRAVASSDQIIAELLDYVQEPAPNDSVFAVGDSILQALRSVPLPPVIHLHAPSRDGAAQTLVRANQDQITRIFVNLIQNAIQAMPEGGELVISTSLDEQGCVIVNVRDTGCGIPPENLGKIFEPLFSTKTRGIGLGLAIAKRYAGLNRGQLSVESEPGRGTTFRLRLETFR